MKHADWMNCALDEAKKARKAGELPIGCVVVADGVELARSGTAVQEKGSPVAHAELLTLLQCSSLSTSTHPIVLYTTLEPCLMCLGAAIQAGVDQIVYGMRCQPDGAALFATMLQDDGQTVPAIVGRVLEKECVEEFRLWKQSKNHPAASYVQEILAPYGKK